MKRILLAIFFSLIAVPAFAACTPGFIATPGSGSNQTFSTKAAADTNCESLFDIDTSSQLHTDLTAPASLGSASGGWSKKKLNALSTTVTSIKSSAAGQLGMLHCGNSNASSAFVQVFDVATAGGVTLGTTAPDLSFEITSTSSSGFTLPLVGIQFANGIQIAATTTATGSSALGSALNCNAAYN